MIKISNLRHRYATSGFELVVDDLNVARGSKVALCGSSGCGKSTLLMLIAGILQPQSGQIEVANLDVASASPTQRRSLRTKRIGFVFQDFELLDYLPVLENIYLPARVAGWKEQRSLMLGRAAQLASECGLAQKLKRYPKQLSQGERQRVAICRALVTQPELILADEPTASLDQTTTQEVIELLTQQVAACGSTLLMVTHDRSLLDRFDHTVELSPGVTVRA